LLTGHGPFGASEVGDVAAAHIRKAPLDLHEAYPRIPAALADALKRCLAKKPEHRPSARVLADLLRDDQPAVVAEPGAGSGPANAFTDFLSELQKRKVYSAAVTYGVVTFAVLQGADLILPALNTGDAVYRVLVIAFLSGFPVAMWLSWVYDLNRGRLERADDLDASFARRASRGQRIALQSLGLALSVGIAIGIAVWLL
jgi:hypothetical protein